MQQVAEWIWSNVWTLIAVGIIIRYGKSLYLKLVFDPLAGGNGKVQMDEAAKGIILGVFVFSAFVEAFRKHEYHIFSDAYYFSLLLSVCAIAAIKPAFSKMKKDEPKE